MTAEAPPGAMEPLMHAKRLKYDSGARLATSSGAGPDSGDTSPLSSTPHSPLSSDGPSSVVEYPSAAAPKSAKRKVGGKRGRTGAAPAAAPRRRRARLLPLARPAGHCGKLGKAAP